MTTLTTGTGIAAETFFRPCIFKLRSGLGQCISGLMVILQVAASVTTIIVGDLKTESQLWRQRLDDEKEVWR